MSSAIVTAVVLGLLVAETRLSLAHERRLRARGAAQPPGDVYRALAIAYPLAFLAMGVEGVWREAHEPGAVGASPNWFLSGVLLFAAAKALKYWAIHALGERWTFKVFIVPGQPLVTTGPYRYVAHPNYVGVVGELVGAAMMCGAPATGSIGFVVFSLVLWRRVRFESQVLNRVRQESGR